MKLTIEKHIFELLKYHDCVIITGLGGFILNYRGAYINQITHKIYPPSKIISFNANLSGNDGLLANYLTEVENIDYNEACLEILKFSRKAKLKLEKGETIIFKNIGTLNLNDAKKIEFSTKNEFNFNTDSYGLTSFQIAKLEANTKKNNPGFMSAAAAIILLICISIFSLTNDSMENMMLFNLHPINNHQYTPRNIVLEEEILGKETPGIYNVQVSQVDFDLYKINGTNYHIATKKCFKLGFGRDVQIKIWEDKKNRTQRQVCFLNVSETEYDDCYKITNVYNEISSNSDKVMVLTKRGKMKEALLVLEETYIDPYIIANSIPEEDLDSDNQDSLSIKNIGSRFVNAIQTLSEPTKDNSTVNTIELDNINNITEKNRRSKNVYIIVGSFSSITNAKALVKQLKKRGFVNANIIGKNKKGLMRVSVDDFYTEEEANLVLDEIRTKLSSAWVLNEAE